MDLATEPVSLAPDWVQRARVGGLAAVSSTGVLGDPRGANAQHGVSLLERWCAEVVAMIDEHWGRR
jgi:creatinine amidohydrolase/Fe(II)-dependent formamide hydrolase-like protein